MRFISDDEKLHGIVLREVVEKLLESNWDLTPPELAHQVHGIVKRIINESDSYKEVKRESNDLVLKMYPELKETVNKSRDPLKAAAKLAIAGNIIDFAVLQEFNLEETIREVFEKSLSSAITGSSKRN